jgi:phospholipid-binding lipoprotein MlaA
MMRALFTSRFPGPGSLRALVLAGCVLASLATLAGCATPPPADDPEAVAEFKELNDPLEPGNRVAFDVNTVLDDAIMQPIARAYRFVLPEEARKGIDNVLHNLATPVRLGNDILSGKPRRAGDTTMRFFINTTAGVLGVFDVASGLGYGKHDSDFGLTLGSWGVEDGPFLFVPVLGPSSPRDLTGFAVDRVGNPFFWVGQGTAVTALGWSRFGVAAISARERVLDPVEQTRKTALDPYATFRSLYRQYREGQLRKLHEDNRATIPVWFRDRAGEQINPPPG